jgi:hypothetical protein
MFPPPKKKHFFPIINNEKKKYNRLRFIVFCGAAARMLAPARISIHFFVSLSGAKITPFAPPKPSRKPQEAQEEVDKKRADLRDDSEKVLQGWFIIRKFGQQEKIRVNNKDLDMAYRSMAAQQGMDVKMVKKFYKAQNMEDDLRSEIHESKVRSHIVQQVLEANQAEAVDSVKA